MRTSKISIPLAVFSFAACHVHAQSPDLFGSAEAGQNVGKVATVCCTVVQGTHMMSLKGEPTFLNCDGRFRSANHTFTFVIWGTARPDYYPPPEQLQGKCACGTGPISTYQSKPQIQNPKSLYEARTDDEKSKCRR